MFNNTSVCTVWDYMKSLLRNTDLGLWYSVCLISDRNIELNLKREEIRQSKKKVCTENGFGANIWPNSKMQQEAASGLWSFKLSQLTEY